MTKALTSIGLADVAVTIVATEDIATLPVQVVIISVEISCVIRKTFTRHDGSLGVRQREEAVNLRSRPAACQLFSWASCG